MGEASGEVEGELAHSRAVRLLVLAGGAACILSAIMYLLALTQPLCYFRGFIEGYVSLAGYYLRYNHNGMHIRLYHSDYVSPVSSAAVYMALTLLIVSIVSAILPLVRRRTLLPISLLYGVSSALIISTGIIRFLLQALEADIGGILNYNNAQVVIETSAGIIRYPGVAVERSLIYMVLAGKLPLYPLQLAVSTALITMAMLAVVLRYMGAPLDKWVVLIKREVGRWLGAAGGAAALMLLSSTLLSTWASAFAYQPWTTTVQPAPPPAALTNPPHMYTCAAITRTARGALTYTDFETYPIPGWTSRGGTWSRVDHGGYRGHALQGTDNNGGIGGASQYYWNTRVDSYSSLWASVRVRLASGGETYRGLALIRSDLNGLYEVSIYYGRVYVWKWVWLWSNLGSATISGYSSGAWYTIVSHHVVTSSDVSFYVWVYDTGGRQVAYLTVSDTAPTRFTPAYVGLEVDGAGTIYFDDFIVSRVDPRYISFSGLQTNMAVEVWDNLGNLVNSTTGSGTVSLSVLRDIVAGTGLDGRIIAKYPDGFSCISHTVPTADAILGGDSYNLMVYPISTAFGENRTSAQATLYISSSSSANTTARALSISAARTLYARLILEEYSTPPTLYAAIWIRGATESTKIIISGGAPKTSTTDIVALNVGSANHIVVSGYFTETERTATLKIFLEISTLNGAGACAYYPIVIELRGGQAKAVYGSTPANMELPEGGPIDQNPNDTENRSVGEDGQEPDIYIWEPPDRI